MHTSTNGIHGHKTNGTAPTEKPALETAIAQVEILRGDFRNAITGLNKLSEALKAAQREQKLDPAAAIHQACLIRFRPIMMTTAAALMGGLPIALGYGAGGAARRPLGLAVVGGLLFSQTLTLYVTPVFYVYMEKFRKWLHPEG